MGDLPSSRVVPSAPFLKAAVDLAGPFTVKESIRPKALTYKAYFALFVCLATKACHIEVLTSLSSEEFINTLHRFVSRRGLPKEIFCDQGTNFKGAARRLKEIVEFLRSSENQSDVCDAMSSKSIQFRFNIPHAPFMNGICESNIKNVKFHLFREVGNSVLTIVELSTLLVKIEAILNSRPLYALSSSPDDYEALSPGHFLVHRPLLAVPEIDVSDVNEHRLSRWEKVNRFTQRLWRRWESEYLHTLQQKNKWFESDTNLQVGQLVWIKENNSSPLSYPLGRVTQIISDAKGIVRSAHVKTNSGAVLGGWEIRAVGGLGCSLTLWATSLDSWWSAHGSTVCPST
ncbi:uncharacterized protein LOC120351623 [Nilaparvata lugens]|uniref:uncharacterized protein LOC120351623 n=1 Tax=Nilaparvata lugens TaxID=108931 RepID=UPI00193CE8A1|nr:uncharacterized protein LOC120351623 [Nilaparvata lugens]